MARTNITVRNLDERNKLSEGFSTLTEAVDATTKQAEFKMDKRDDKILLLIQNVAVADKTVTIKAGNGIQGVNDLVATVSASSYSILAIDSGRFKNVSGDDKGKVVLEGESADIKVAVFMLP